MRSSSESSVLPLASSSHSTSVPTGTAQLPSATVITASPSSSPTPVSGVLSTSPAALKRRTPPRGPARTSARCGMPLASQVPPCRSGRPTELQVSVTDSLVTTSSGQPPGCPLTHAPAVQLPPLQALPLATSLLRQTPLPHTSGLVHSSLV